MTTGGAVDAAELARRIEETCFNAFPSLKQVIYRGDWLMRFADGLSRRANSVNPLGPDCGEVEAAIAVAESLYGAQGLPTIFRVPSLADPGLDRALSERGYTAEGESCVLYAEIAAVAAVKDPAARLFERPVPEWLRAMSRWQRHTAAQADMYRRIVGAIAVPAWFAMLVADGAPVALAYGALHDGLLCYESVITDPACRRQGLGRRIIAGLAASARDSGASGVCLQVEATNAPARALYTDFGMRELYRYHYRRQPPSLTSGDGVSRST